MIYAYSPSTILKSFVPFSHSQGLSLKASERENVINIKSLSYFDKNSENVKRYCEVYERLTKKNKFP